MKFANIVRENEAIPNGLSFMFDRRTDVMSDPRAYPDRIYNVGVYLTLGPVVLSVRAAFRRPVRSGTHYWM